MDSSSLTLGIIAGGFLISRISYPAENLQDAWRFYRLKRAATNLIGSGILLDVGCNDCSFSHFILNHPLKYLGVDRSRDAIIEGKGVDRIICDACYLPIREGAIDLATCIELIEHVGEPILMLREISRVLKKRGNLLISTPNDKSIFRRLQERLHLPKIHDWRYVKSHLRVYTPKQFDSLLRRCGFEIVRKINFIAFPPIRMLKTRPKIFRMLLFLSKPIPSDFDELLIRVATKSK